MPKTKLQNCLLFLEKHVTAFLKKGKYFKKEKFLVNLSDLMSNFIFSELKA